MSVQIATVAPPALRVRQVLATEGLRLFFPLAALHAALWPLLWVYVHGFGLPLAHTTPPALWHAHEMLIGAFGAALIGFITTAVPEWTDTEPLRGRALYALAGVWAVARLIGLAGSDALQIVGALADLLWLGVLVGYLAQVSLRKRTTRLLAFAGWIGAIALGAAAVRLALLIGEVALARAALGLVGLSFLGLLGIALGRITVPVTNLILDPSEATSPFRPHPGRLALSSALVAVAIAGQLAGHSPATNGFLLIAAGAAFLDRVGEAFVGREALRAEIMALAGSSALAGAGLVLAGASGLGAPIPATAGWHVALMGGLGLGVLAVFSIAGLRHTGQALVFSRATRAALACLVASVGLRVLPEFGVAVPGPPHGLAALAWAAAFLIWLRVYWPLLTDPATVGERSC